MKRSIHSTHLGLIALLLSSGCTTVSQPKNAQNSAENTPATDAPAAEAPPAPPEQESKPQAMEVLSVSGSFVAPLPTAVTSFGIAQAAGRAYVLGGYHGIPHAYSKEGQSKDLMVFDPAEPSVWKKLSELPVGVQGLAAVAYKNQVCQIGGLVAKNVQGEEADLHSVATFSCFDLESKQWRELPALPTGRSSHDATIAGSKVYVAGGWQLTGSTKTAAWQKSLLVFDFENEAAGWQEIETPFAVRAVGVGVSADQVVIAGGMSEEGKPISKVRLYDLKTQEWKEGPDFPADAFGLAVAAADGEIYASAIDGMVRRLNLKENRWDDIRPLGFSRFFHQLAVLDEQLLVIGGIGGMHTRGRTKITELLPLDVSKTAYSQIDIKNPSRAKNRQGYLFHGEEFYLFGGNNSLGQHDFGAEHFESAGFIFDMATLNYREAPAYPHARQSLVTVPTRQGGLALGGFGVEGGAGPAAPSDGTPGAEGEGAKLADAQTQAEVYSWSWADEAWKEESPLPLGRTQFGVAEGEDDFTILGGLNYDPEKKGMDAFDHRLDLLSSGSKPIAFQVAEQVMPGPRRAFAGASLGEDYYLVGGMKEGFQLVEDCQIYRSASKSFESFPCPGAPRLSGELVVVAGKLYLLGGSVKGEKGLDESRRIAVFDPENKTWSELDFELPLSVRHLRAFSFNNQIALFTTHYEDDRVTFALLNPAQL